MSSFCGLIKEIPGISVDRFTHENLNSSVYFLSHCHTDHMCGLDCSFFEHLKQSTKYFYCSPISKVILETKYPQSSLYVKDIAINQKLLIEYKNRNGDRDVFFVTCISAGHCPGSVMFLFEKDDKLILYTGDFRLNPSDYAKIAPLHYKDSNKVLPKKFTTIYLDTTFLDSNFRTLPTRQECVNVICKIIKEWLEKNSMNVVVLECSALYGAEFLYIELSKSLNIPIHVKDNVYSSYLRIPDLRYHITQKAHITPIHACMNKSSYYQDLKCRPNIPQDNILTIVPSTLRWKGKDTSVIGEWDNVRERTFNVCYSMHASFNELKAFIRYFEADEIFPCVIPRNTLECVVYYTLEKIKKNEDITEDSEKYTLQVLTHEDMSKSWAENY